MIIVGNSLRATTREEADLLANKIQAAIDKALEKVYTAKSAHHDLCVRLYPVGSRVEVLVAARRAPIHEVIKVNEHGWLTLRNVYTGTLRGMSASSDNIRPSRSWYEQGATT